ncbi:uncharacterized protein GGS22DRAFT_197712 [Annulohypoxylon maeteangense]|uniref:uncharacterized protein n=1 Tax=Annulohypoxylon maeteangense TaxID=1927788 RepID=UPI0020086106|nr:uncharacterized protein GGS22DRAFT_197712 [Annulohypoxylon maeteangense]KAI0887743.1 hypothetical protein GGS22DRAFT_197712 [Annulohypoxylon maeteangense]
MAPILESVIEDYRYTALPEQGPGDLYIRLLDILPGGPKDEALRLGLRTTRLEESPTYECLSYAWGTSDGDREEKEVFVVGPNAESFKLRIRKNLNDALRALRHSSRSRTIWADAICINQEDHEERSSQVILMGLIYWSASRVNIWLGPDRRGVAKMAFEAVKPISAAHWETDARLSSFSKEQAAELDPVPWEGVAELYRNSWFERAWVQQELGLSKEAYFYWGDSPPIDVRDLFSFDLWMESVGDSVRARFIGDASGVRGTRNLWLQYSRVTRSDWPGDPDQFMAENPFLQVLVDGSNCKATDPRDHVYAFLGHPAARRRNAYENDQSMNYAEIFIDVNHTFITPDYRRTVDEVFLDVAKKLLVQHNDLRILGAVSHSTGTIASDYPSWVPRWNANQHRKTIGISVSIWPTKIDVPGLPTTRIEVNALHVQGLVISTVSSLLKWTKECIQVATVDVFARKNTIEMLYGRRLFQTKDGRKGMVQDIVQAGDVVALLVGACSPCVLRHVEGGKFKLVGTCLMLGLADDDLNDMINNRRGQIQEMIIV